MGASQASDKEVEYKTVVLPIKTTEWMDADYRMIYACFEILGDFVENELKKSSDELSYRGYNNFAIKGTEKVIDLWLWYREFIKNLDEFDKNDERLHNDEILEEKFQELLQVRKSLWT